MKSFQKNFLTKVNKNKRMSSLFILASLLWLISTHRIFNKIFESEFDNISSIINSQLRQEVYLNNYELALRTLNELSHRKIISCSRLRSGIDNGIVLFDKFDDKICKKDHKFKLFKKQKIFKINSISGQSYTFEYLYFPSFSILIGYGLTLLLGFVVVTSSILIIRFRERSIYTKTESEIRIANIARRVAHDINSPLSSLKIAIEKIEESDLSYSIKKIVRTTAVRIEQIAQELLDSSREQYFEVEKKIVASKDTDFENLMQIRPSIVIRNLIEEIQPTYKGNINLKIRNDNFILVGTIIDFERVISNLIRNSIDATDKEIASIEIILIQNDMYLDIKIKDNGKGIPSKVIKNLFQKNFTYGKKNGNGLALYWAKELISKWGGLISISSIENMGTEVTLSLRIVY